jgi:hypothetical protein
MLIHYIEEKLRGIKLGRVNNICPHALRSRGFIPKLSDAELITMAMVGHLPYQQAIMFLK